MKVKIQHNLEPDYRTIPQSGVPLCSSPPLPLTTPLSLVPTLPPSLPLLLFFGVVTRGNQKIGASSSHEPLSLKFNHLLHLEMPLPLA